MQSFEFRVDLACFALQFNDQQTSRIQRIPWVNCGFCGPGVIMSAKALLDQNPNPSVLEIRDALAGNLCRCTGYTKMIEAIQEIAKQ